MRNLILIAALLGLLLGGCVLSESNTVAEVYVDDQVALTLTEKELTILNVGDETIYFTIFPFEILPNIEWAPCSDLDTCTEGVDPGEEMTVRMKGIVKRETTSIAFYWWRLIEAPDDGGFTTADLTEAVLAIP